MGAGVVGVVIGLLTILVTGPTPPLPLTAARTNPFCEPALICYRLRRFAGCSQVPFSWVSQERPFMPFPFRF